MCSKDVEPMTLEEAKEFYMRFNGFGFHMCREEPGLYEKFVSLKLSNDILSSWSYEVLDRFRNRILDPNRKEKWYIFEDFLNMYGSLNSGIDKYTKIFFELLEYAIASLDPKQKILIMEGMAGRNYYQTDGGIRYICKKSSYRKELKEILNRLVDFDYSFITNDTGWEEPTKRYLAALERINKALKMFY